MPEIIRPSNPSETINPKENEPDLIEHRLLDKINAARELSREYLNSIPGKDYGKITNQELIGRYFYKALFASNEEIPELEGLVANNPQLRDKLDQIYTPITGLGMDNFNSAQAFADQFREMISHHNLPKKPEYEDKKYTEIIYFSGAQDEVEKMLTYGPVRIWTAGDMYGLPDEGLKGSGEQIKRTAQAGWGTIRNKARQEGKSLDVLAHENKMNLLAGIVEDYKSHQVENFVVVDDKVANLDEAHAKLVESGVKAENIILIWDRQGNGGLGGLVKEKSEEDITQIEKRYNAIDKVEDILAKTNSILNLDDNETRVGWIIDHDDVLSNTDKVRQIVKENVLDWLKGKEIY